MVKILYRKYKAQGFVEALIAIVLVGILGISLLDIAGSSIRNVVRIQKEDQLTQLAFVGSEMAKILAENYNSKTSNFFPTASGFVNQCFGLSGDIGDPSFTSESPISSYSECLSHSSACTGSDGETFRRFCLKSYDSRKEIAIGSIYTGFVNCESGASGTCRIRDYEQTVILKVRN